jgi:trehalose 6-phosphate phosphatase
VPGDPDDVLALLRADPATTAIVTDFDGTLSPIVADPAMAAPLPGVVDVLHELAGRYGRVAVVSGRPAAFLRDRLEIDRRPPSALFVSGLYGIEWIEAGVEHVHETAESFRTVVDDVADRAEAAAPIGVHVERKGYSLTLHVRNASEHEGWARDWAEAEAVRTGLALHPARRSFELRPPVDLDKGTVVDALVDGVSAACFLGDDLGDLPAFDALDRLGERTGGAVTVRIAARSTEAPAPLLERADVVVDGPEGALAFLRSLR